MPQRPEEDALKEQRPPLGPAELGRLKALFTVGSVVGVLFVRIVDEELGED